MKYVPLTLSVIFGFALIGLALWVTKSPHCLWGLVGVAVVCKEVQPETEFYNCCEDEEIDDSEENINEN